MLKLMKMKAPLEHDVPAKVLPPIEREISEELEIKVKKYLRGEGTNFDALKDKKLKGQLFVREEIHGRAALTAAKAEKWLLPSKEGCLEVDGIEKTWNIRQEQIAPKVAIASLKNQYDIVLPDFAPYTLDFTSSGRYMAVAGRKGHLAIIDARKMSLIKEMHVRETVRDVVFLHNELFFATAQKKYPYIYDRDGVELHCLKEHGSVLRLQFLRNHFLLASISKMGQLRYQDVTTGEMAGNLKAGRAHVMKANPFNGVVALGHSGGVVSMWKPTTQVPLMRMLCHATPLTAIAFHPNGHLMATSGKEKMVKLWDLRKLEALQTFRCHATVLEFSQRGLLAVGAGSSVQILRSQSGSPAAYGRYMSHSLAKSHQIGKLLFRPYEDVLGIGHSDGWSSILIPGSGEPNFDNWVANPLETPKQRREKEIHSLLDKLPPETIMLDPSTIGTVLPVKKKETWRKQEEMDAEMDASAAAAAVGRIALKNKAKGRNKPSKRAKKRKEMALAEKSKRAFMDREILDPEAKRRKKQRVADDDDKDDVEDETTLPLSLRRFLPKSR